MIRLVSHFAVPPSITDTCMVSDESSWDPSVGGADGQELKLTSSWSCHCFGLVRLRHLM
jgi:hypothetical protein